MHQKVIKAATADTRGLPVSDGSLEHLARETRCAAFACGSALVTATQKTNPKIFAALFLKEQKGIDPAGDRQCISHPILHRTCTGMGMTNGSQDGKVGRHPPYMWHAFSLGNMHAAPQERICLPSCATQNFLQTCRSMQTKCNWITCT